MARSNHNRGVKIMAIILVVAMLVSMGTALVLAFATM